VGRSRISGFPFRLTGEREGEGLEPEGTARSVRRSKGYLLGALSGEGEARESEDVTARGE